MGPKKRKTIVDEDDNDFEGPPEVTDSPKIIIKEDNTHSVSYHEFSEQEIDKIRTDLLAWYDKVQRTMPWRIPSDAFLHKHDGKLDPSDYFHDDNGLHHPYAVLVSELMLQQTQVETVKSYFRKWMKEFPDIQSLAAASLERVKEFWAGLGYYRRATLLHKCAQVVVEKYDGIIPSSVEELEKLPGIGKYTAGAIASVAYGEAVPLIDGNVIRVLTRLRTIATDPKGSVANKLMWKLAGNLVDFKRPGDFNQALMELGSQLCTVQNPSCNKCPIRSCCNAYKELCEGKAKVEDQTYAPCTICTSSDTSLAVTKYPIKTEKKKKRDMFTHVCIVKNELESSDPLYLLVQRPNTGLLAGFWEFSSVEIPIENYNTVTDVPYKARKDVMDRYLSQFVDIDLIHKANERREIGSTTHIFSHIKQHLSVETLTIYTSNLNLKSETSDYSCNWFTKETLLNMAISKSVKKCFDILTTNNSAKIVAKRKRTGLVPLKGQIPINKCFNLQK